MPEISVNNLLKCIELRARELTTVHCLFSGLKQKVCNTVYNVCIHKIEVYYASLIIAFVYESDLTLELIPPANKLQQYKLTFIGIVKHNTKKQLFIMYESQDI